jgi:hypothetical protein
MIAFIHIQKTAGQSVTHAVCRMLPVGSVPHNYGSDMRSPNHPSGHVDFSYGHVYPHNVPPQAKQFTVLRDPAERYISDYYWLRPYRDGHSFFWRNGANPTWNDYAADPCTHDWQVKMLAGVPHDGVAHEEDLETAKCVLGKMFAVGFTDDLPALFAAVGKEIGSNRIIKPPRMNATPRGSDHSHEGAVLRNALDYELYEWARNQ